MWKRFKSTTFFTGSELDRQSTKRLLTERLLNERKVSRTMIFDNLKYLSSNERICWLDHDQTKEFFDVKSAVYLGKDIQFDIGYWAMDVSNLKVDFDQYGEFVHSRPAAFRLPNMEAALFAQARSMIDWNARYIYCPTCSTKTLSSDAGYKRTCENKGCVSHSTTQNYSHPRTDAVVISAIVSPCGQKLLLGRKKIWPSKMYSCIAGFVEPGESMEEAVVREAKEETGIEIEAVSYHSSQPWPFPSQLMLGSISYAKTTDILLDDEELEETYRDALNKPHPNKPHTKKRNRKKKPIKITFVNHIDNEFDKVLQDIQELVTSGYEDEIESVGGEFSRSDYTPEEIGLHIFDDYHMFNDSSLSSSVRSNSYWIGIVLLMEFMMHNLYVVAIKNAKAFKGFSSLEIYCLGYFNLKFIWLKLMIIWRFFRMWAMFDDIETTENMTRCITNQYSAQEFWKHWHSSYNKFLIRYLYIPLGGKQYKMLNTFCIFTFVAIWHDINLQLLTWGWLISIFILPEIICTGLFCTPKNKEKSWYLDVCALGGVWNLLQMITANLVGFAVGIDGIIEMYHEMWNLEVCIRMFSVVFTLIVKKRLNTGSKK
ncbi:glycerol transporter [Terramyces sp. JEL0728]|nr:glycerol transporter [Terramyces sp. JEL0728]